MSELAGDERALVTEERPVPNALAAHSRQVTRVEEALESLYDERLSSVLAESRVTPSDDRLVAVTPHTDVPLAQASAARRSASRRSSAASATCTTGRASSPLRRRLPDGSTSSGRYAACRYGRSGVPSNAMTPEPAQNSTGTAAASVPGKPFEKGRSGNPAGRPKGLARKVREILGDDDGETLARFWAAALSGELVTVTTDVATGERKEERTKVGVKERIEVSKLLAERGWGKPPQFAPIEDDDPLDLAAEQAAEAARSLDAHIDEVAAQRLKREGLTDAEPAQG